ncbi:MAG: tRNA lysidine(34) synthetase TilS [Planctomycetales bacterium]|nr:tRNA lysidine(34) synthetase TilS [Planctomycetales bacterium]
MTESPPTCYLEQLARGWPPQRWRDVNVLVAVSGGADSVALLRGLLQLKQTAGGAGALLAAHVNHQLRGAESQRQQRWVADLAEGLKTPLVVESCEVSARAAAEGDGVEAAARAERYDALARMAGAAGARYVAVGHTRDDQAETVVMRLLRGAGLRGLGGMRHARPLTDGVALVRPLLDIPRADVERHLAAIGQPWVHDDSNDELRFTRNHVRHEVLPALRSACHGDLNALLAELAGDAQGASDAVEAAARAALETCRSDPPAASAPGTMIFCLYLAALATCAPLVRTEALRLAWREAGLPEQAMTRRHWEDLAALVERPGAAPINLPGNLRANVAGGLLIMERLANA